MTAAPPPATTPPGPTTGEELRGAVVVLTGVGRPGQLGEVVAATFARRGVHLILVAREMDRAERVAGEVRASGVDAFPHACDLTSVAQTGQLARDVAQRAPNGVKALVHMAGGYAEGAPVAELDPEVWHRLVAINLTTSFVTSRALLPLVRGARGSLVFFSASTALPGAPVARSAAYAAAKGGVATLVRAIAAEEKSAGVRCNALAPLAIRTASNIRSMGAEHRYVERETVAEWVWWLCSAASGPVSGQVIRLG